ncbi:MAG: cytochrome c oxidase subunit II [archaeon]|nr:MAG: cytochrome c oxidase subunit II [archaeon]
MLQGLLSTTPPTTATFDFLLNWYVFFGTGAAVVVIAMLAFFMIRYRSRGDQEPPLEHKTEGWKIVLVTVLISISVLSAAEYQTFAAFGNIEIPAACTQTPNQCVQIQVSAYQWGWSFTYPNGRSVSNNLTVPAGKIILLNVTTKDVFHTFGINVLAVKEDAIGGKTNQLWFMVPDPGFYKNAIRCFEFCGFGHAKMFANLTVVSQGAWDAWQGH